MRMHSADYAVARCLSIRLSVRHTPVLSLNGYTYPQWYIHIIQRQITKKTVADRAMFTMADQ